MDPQAEQPVSAIYDARTYDLVAWDRTEGFEGFCILGEPGTKLVFVVRADRCKFLFKSDVDRIAVPTSLPGRWRCNICGGLVKANADGFECKKDGQIYMTS